MHLDVPTLGVAGSLVTVASGIVLLLVWTTDRAERTPLIWGLANVFLGVALAILLVAASNGAASNGAASTEAAAEGKDWLLMLVGMFFNTGDVLVWAAVRQFSHRPVRSRTLLSLIGLGLLLSMLSVSFNWGVAQAVISDGLGFVLFCAAAAVLFRARAEKLWGRPLLIGILLLHACALLLFLLNPFLGPLPSAYLPPLSIFSAIQFEMLIYAAGSSALLIDILRARREVREREFARIDVMTGVSNRRGLTEQADVVLSRARESGAPVVVLLFDLDHFKSINDRFGHRAGDDVIRAFCETAIGGLRPHDIFGRLGGEEFAAVLPRCSLEAGLGIAERIRASFAGVKPRIKNTTIAATVSIGVAAAEAEDTDLVLILEKADQALYAAKEGGRNRVSRFPPPDRDEPPPAFIRIA